jgi:hypothetical protein
VSSGVHDAAVCAKGRFFRVNSMPRSSNANASADADSGGAKCLLLSNSDAVLICC